MDRAYSLLTIKSADNEHRVIEGIASTPTPDRMQDIVEPLGAQYRLPLPLLLRHNSDSPVGEVTFANPGKDGIPFTARLTKPTSDMPAALVERLDVAWAEVKAKLIRGVSIGFRALETSFIEATGGVRFQKWEWLELSLVTIPANQEATITAIKSIDARQRRAALGTSAANSRDDSTSAGATAQRPKGTTMKTLQDLQARRDEVAARMKEMWDGCGGDRAQFEPDDVKEFDSLKKELGELDADIDDARAIERATRGAIAVAPAIITSQAAGSRARRGETEDRPKVDAAQKGIAFAQLHKVKWLSRKHAIDARQIADSMGSRLDPRVPKILKTAVTSGSVGGTTTAGNWGMELVGDETGVVADFIEFLRPQTILGKFGMGGVPSLRRVPFRVPLVGMTDGGDGYWVGEGLAKPLTSFAFSRTTLEPLKVAAICVVTEELLADSSPAADGLLRDALAKALIERTDIDFIDPDKAVSAGVSPASITNGVSQTGATGTGDADDVRADVRAVMAGFIAANNPPTSGVWIMSATTALGLSLMRNALGQVEFPGVSMNGGTFVGLPVIASEYVPTSSTGHFVVLANAQDIYYADDGDVRIDTSQHASIEMSDDPENESGTVVNMFQTNRVAFRAERRLDWMKRRATAVQVLKNVNWGEA